MTDTPATVSVVVIVRDGMPHLASALGSILQQTDVDIAEIVVVDGGSSDGSREQALSVSAVRVVDQEGAGIGDARNTGLMHTHGDVVAFLDSDDVWTRGSLAIRLSALAAADAVVGHMVTVPLVGEGVPRHRDATIGLATIGYTPSALVVRRSTVDRIGPFAEHLSIGADSEWFARLLDSGVALTVLDSVVLHKGVRQSSLSVDVDRYRRELLGVARDHVRRRRTSDEAG